MGDCPVCFEDMGARILCTFPCKHSVCLHCTLALQSATCPLCRDDLSAFLPPRAWTRFRRRRLFATPSPLSLGRTAGDDELPDFVVLRTTTSSLGHRESQIVFLSTHSSTEEGEGQSERGAAIVPEEAEEEGVGAYPPSAQS